jgi:hypothetical protein
MMLHHTAYITIALMSDCCMLLRIVCWLLFAVCWDIIASCVYGVMLLCFVCCIHPTVPACPPARQVIYLSSAEPATPAAATSKASSKKKKGSSSGGSSAPPDLSQYFISSLVNNLATLTPALLSPEAAALRGVFVLHGAPSVVAAMKGSLCALIEGRGGGRPGKLQGA